MALFEWTQEMSVGIDVIDADHQLLVSLINQLDDAVKDGQPQKTTGSVLNVLYDYTDFHFDREERMMDAVGYPDLENHKQTHKALKDKVLEIRDSYAGGSTDGIEDEVMTLLKDWLKEHIMGRDRLYQAAMAEHLDAAMKAATTFNSADVWGADDDEAYDDPFNPSY